MNDRGQPIGLLLANVGLDGDLTDLELVHTSRRHKLYRHVTSDAATIVIKLNAAGLANVCVAASVRHEFAMLRDLEISGIVSVLGLIDTENGSALVLEDAGESNLAERLRSGPLSIATFLNIAIQLAETVSPLHDARIIHRDIHPGNVVWNAHSEVATLCDFAMARTLPLVMGSQSSNELERTLPCMSPEQTGRTGRSVDSRADLYSLRAIFYEMLTGAPSFAARDAVALAHAQIARLARPPHEIGSQVPLAP